MKIAFAGKGGVGKTTMAAWTADYLARKGKNVWLVDADTALSLGRASGLEPGKMPVALIQRADLVRERIGAGMISLNPDVGDLPEQLAVDVPMGGEPFPGCDAGRKRLLVMGTVTNAGGGCACGANALLKALLGHVVLDREDWVLVDLEAGVEHLGRGTVAGVDALVVVSEPSRRGLETAARIGQIASELGLSRQFLVLNRLAPSKNGDGGLPSFGNSGLDGLPGQGLGVPALDGLAARQLEDASVLDLPEVGQVDALVEKLLDMLKQ